jgi:hypothetical protein
MATGLPPSPPSYDSVADGGDDVDDVNFVIAAALPRYSAPTLPFQQKSGLLLPLFLLPLSLLLLFTLAPDSNMSSLGNFFKVSF